MESLIISSVGESVGKRIYLNTAFKSANWYSLVEGGWTMSVTFFIVHTLIPSNIMLESFPNRAYPRTFRTALLVKRQD